ncbi:hypothetical protein [Mucilaginibacter gilvus]|uniref:Uncharacterized protein n=1 Tax=Mucilaginibacter gilvus TaxID=2305909 RepID=A0A444MJP8_9SPHI|nr:hypothetical protein [Mucilaginibacter gilvus]RWY48565.1 hypothetical protein EPL05_19160 [Mucilaginibacter gilvus]
MNVNLSPLEQPTTCHTDDYLDMLLHGPHNSSAMDMELKKINAHVVQEEARMSRLITSIGITLFLVMLFCLFCLPGIASTGVLVFPR